MRNKLTIARHVCKRLNLELFTCSIAVINNGVPLDWILSNGYYFGISGSKRALSKLGIDMKPHIFHPTGNDHILLHEIGHALDSECILPIEATPEQILEQELIASAFADRQLGKSDRLHTAYKGYKDDHCSTQPSLQNVIRRVRMVEKRFKELSEGINNDTD